MTAASESWIALLRGINVGGRNAVPMARLREVFAAAGCGSVSTYIQSGNVVFTRAATDRDALARELEDAVAEEFGLRAVVVLRTSAELRDLVRAHPFGDDASRTHVLFLAAEPRPEDAERLAREDVAPDRFALAGRDVYLHYPNGVGRARLTGALLERRLGVAGTARNWRTVTRLAELAP